MKPDARRAFGTAPASGLRFEHRAPADAPATLHVDGSQPRDVTLADLTQRGCRVGIATGLPIAAHVSLMLDGASLISGRVAWNDGAAIGIDFCTPLLPRTLARLATPMR